jgi:hypothetical protein
MVSKMHGWLTHPETPAPQFPKKGKSLDIRDLGSLAERVGFEPTVGSHLRQFSRLLP